MQCRYIYTYSYLFKNQFNIYLSHLWYKKKKHLADKCILLRISQSDLESYINIRFQPKHQVHTNVNQ